MIKYTSLHVSSDVVIKGTTQTHFPELESLLPLLLLLLGDTDPAGRDWGRGEEEGGGGRGRGGEGGCATR